MKVLEAWLSRRRPQITVTASRTCLRVASIDALVAAPVVWFNGEGLVAAVGEEPRAAALGFARVDLCDRYGALGTTGTVGRASELFLRYAFAFAKGPSTGLVLLLAPDVSYQEDDSWEDDSVRRSARAAAFQQVARRLGVHSVTVTRGTAT